MKMFLILTVFTVAVVLVAPWGFPQTRGYIPVSIKYVHPAWKLEPPPPIIANLGDILRFLNEHPNKSVKLKIWNTNHSVAEYTIPPKDSIRHLVQKAGGDRELKVFDPVSGHELVEGAIKPSEQAPTLSDWGIVSLVGLVATSAVIIMLRKRKASVAV